MVRYQFPGLHAAQRQGDAHAEAAVRMPSRLDLLPVAVQVAQAIAHVGQADAASPLRRLLAVVLHFDHQLRPGTFEVDVEPPGSGQRRDAVADRILDQRLQHEVGHDAVQQVGAGLHRQAQAFAEPRLFDLEVGVQQGQFLGQRMLVAAVVGESGAQEVGHAAEHAVGLAVGLARDQRGDRVQGVEQEVRIDLQAQRAQLGFARRGLGLGQVQADLLQRQVVGRHRMHRAEGDQGHEGMDEALVLLNRSQERALFEIAASERTRLEALAAMRSATLALPAATRTALEIPPEGIPDEAFEALLTPWFRRFLSLDPRQYLNRVTCPVLALGGEKDLQVPPAENLKEIERALASRSPQTVVRQLPGLNHNFQTARTGKASEYFLIDETVAPSALALMSTWMKKVVRQ